MTYDALITGLQLNVVSNIVHIILSAMRTTYGETSGWWSLLMEASSIAVLLIHYVCLIRIIMMRTALFRPTEYFIQDGVLYARQLVEVFSRIYEAKMQSPCIEERTIWTFTKWASIDLLLMYHYMVRGRNNSDIAHPLCTLSDISEYEWVNGSMLLRTPNGALTINKSIISIDGSLLRRDLVDHINASKY